MENLFVVVPFNSRGKELRIHRWIASEGKYISDRFHDHVLEVSFESVSSLPPFEKKMKYVKLSGNTEGKLMKYLVSEGGLLPQDCCVGLVKPCPHGQLYERSCVECGKYIPEDSTEKYVPSVDHPDLLSKRVVSMENFRMNAGRMLQRRKLHLVLDIDRTLLHAEFFLPPLWNDAHNMVSSYAENSHNDILHNFTLGNHMFVVKKRPFLEEFLSEVAKYFQLHIFTWSNRAYADNIRRIIDPNMVFFNERVFTRDDCDSTVMYKRLDRLFPEDSRLALVLDDTPSMWKSDQVIVVPRYKFFTAPTGYIPKDEDNGLQSILGLLLDIHKLFFQKIEYNAEVPSASTILRSLDYPTMCDCLQDIHVAFSGLVPMGEDKLLSAPFWKLAQSFGATCHEDIDEEVTHVICCQMGYSRKAIRTFKMPGVFLVRLSWLMECLSRRKRVWESMHIMEITDQISLDGEWVTLFAMHREFLEKSRKLYAEMSSVIDSFASESEVDSDDSESERSDESDEAYEKLAELVSSSDNLQKDNSADEL